jgi:lysophospholipase L1-like esterase
LRCAIGDFWVAADGGTNQGSTNGNQQEIDNQRSFNLKSIVMQHILVYGDSLSWGIIPNTRRRLSFPERWPGVMERALVDGGHQVRVIEDCLNGRRTAWDDPFKPGRNALDGIEQRMEINSPLALVIVMLGANDFQSVHQNNAWHSGQGLASVIRAMRRAPIEPGMPVPPILVVAPPPITTPVGKPIWEKFEGAPARSERAAEAYAAIAAEMECRFYDAGRVVSTSPHDGIHLDADQHATLGAALAKTVTALLAGG